MSEFVPVEDEILPGTLLMAEEGHAVVGTDGLTFRERGTKILHFVDGGPEFRAGEVSASDLFNAICDHVRRKRAKVEVEHE